MRPSKRFVVVGMRFNGNHIFSDGDVVTLEADPDNRYDTNAIRVIANGKHVAYVARNHTQFLSKEDYNRNISLVETMPNFAVLETRE